MRIRLCTIALSTVAVFVAVCAQGAATREQLIQESEALQEEIADRFMIERLGKKAKVELDPRYTKEKTSSLIQRLIDVNAHINGEDGRTNVGTAPLTAETIPRKVSGIPLTEPVIRNIRGVAAMVPLAAMNHIGSKWEPKTPLTYKDVKRVCPDKVRFAFEPALADCTAFLVSPQMMATANHCMKDVMAKNMLFVFDFNADDNYAPQEFPDAHVVAGKTLVDWGVEPSDWALVELEREITDRDPLPIDWVNPVAVGDDVYMIGHSAGLPVKIGGDAKVLRTASQSFVSDVDSLGGNSGSPILSLRTNMVIGILARSREGYVDVGGCNILESCPSSLFTDCDGEGCTRITEIPPFTQTGTPPP